LVHHVILEAAPPAALAAVEALDAADPGPGYDCYGSTRVIGGIYIGGWVPGMSKGVLEEGNAYILPAGSKIVMQVHYNLLAGAPISDLTTLELITQDQPPRFAMRSQFLANPGIVIPAGAANSTHIVEIPISTRPGMELVGTSPHMHLRGKSQRLELIRADDSETCLVEIPRWDFEWQRGYAFRQGAAIALSPGDRFRLTCVYDNSASNQPLVDGQPIEPREVRWGDGTLDEMCLNTITYREPYDPSSEPQGLTCLEVLMCFDGCPDSDRNCDLACYGAVDPAQRDLVDAFVDCYMTNDCAGRDCAQQNCLDQILACQGG
jgi:hypothetical protein